MENKGEKGWPNLFLIGAPKCGTTSMSHYLAQHPDIFMSEKVGLKEPNFFNKDHDIHWRRITTEEEYLALFRNAPRDIRYLGEASALYLYSRVAVKGILQCNPSARFIVMLRNPMELAQSLFNQHLRAKAENTSHFSKAWRLQGPRKSGLASLPGQWRDAKLLQYGSIAKTGEQVRRLFENVSRRQVHIVIYDDFSSNPRDTYLEVLRFLGLDDDGRREFPVLNRKNSYRSLFLADMLQRISLIRERLGIRGGLGINALIDRFNVVKGTRSNPLDNKVRSEMIAYFYDDVVLLSKLLNRDLLHWLKE